MLIFPRSTIWTVAALVSLLSAGRICSAALVTVFDPSFEQPVVTDPTGLDEAPSAAAQGAGPGDSPWMFSTQGAFIASKGAKYSLTGVVPQPPDGNQVLILDGDQQATQQITFSTAGQYILTYDDLELGGTLGAGFFPSGAAEPVSGGPPQHTPLPGSQFEQTSIPFTIPTPGAYLLDIVDSPNFFPPVLVDNVSITPAPEPSCAVLLGPGLVLIRRRKSRP